MEGGPDHAGAVMAAHTAPHLPMSFLTFGGYETTGGTVAPTRDLDRATDCRGSPIPHRIDPDQRRRAAPSTAPTADGIIKLARNARLQRQMEYLTNLAQAQGRPWTR